MGYTCKTTISKLVYYEYGFKVHPTKPVYINYCGLEDSALVAKVLKSAVAVPFIHPHIMVQGLLSHAQNAVTWPALSKRSVYIYRSSFIDIIDYSINADTPCCQK